MTNLLLHNYLIKYKSNKNTNYINHTLRFDEILIHVRLCTFYTYRT